MKLSFKERIRRGAVHTMLRGSRYQCAVCGFHASRVGWVGIEAPLFEAHEIVGSGRRRGRCLACHARDREQLLRLYLEHEVGVIAKAGTLEVLHIAPEPRLSAWLNGLNIKRYVMGDRREPGYHYPAETVFMDVTELPFDPASFDLVLCNHVLEHVPDDALAMREIFRVLKPGARAVLQVPMALDISTTLEDSRINTPEGRLAAYGQADHLRLYGRDYGDRLAAAGFRPDPVFLAEQFPRAILNPREALQVAYRDD